MEMVISKHLLCNDLESSNWNNFETTIKNGCLEFQVELICLVLHFISFELASMRHFLFEWTLAYLSIFGV